jgi:hypothetical protein
MLPMTSLAAVTLTPFLLENQDLLRFGLADNLAGHRGVLQERRADSGVAIAANKQHITESYRFTDLAGKLLNFYQIPFRHPVLLPASFDYCIFHGFSKLFLTEIPAKVNDIGSQGYLR